MVGEVNTRTKITHSTKAFRSGTGIAVHLNNIEIRNLGVEPGDLLEITVRHTGIKNALARPNNFVSFPKSECLEKQESDGHQDLEEQSTSMEDL